MIVGAVAPFTTAVVSLVATSRPSFLSQRKVSAPNERRIADHCTDLQQTATVTVSVSGYLLSGAGKRVSVKGLAKSRFGVCKTVYPGSIPGVASTQTRAREQFVPCAAVQGAGKAQCAPACCGIGGKAGLTCVPRIKSSARLSPFSSFGLGQMYDSD